jgi:hypothetical protein
VGDEEDDTFVTAHVKVHFQAPYTDSEENTLGATRSYPGVVAVEDCNLSGTDVEDRIVCGIPIDTFNDTYWQFRLVLAPYINSNLAKTRFVKCRLMGRKYGTDKWFISDVPITDNDGSTVDRFNEKGLQMAYGVFGSTDQFISFGHGVSVGVAESSMPTASRWKYLHLWSPCTMQQMQDLAPYDGNDPDFSRYEDAPWIYPNCLRGQLFASDPTYVTDGVSLHWGAVGAIERDSWTSTPSFQYSAANLFQPSPRIKWRSPDDTATTNLSQKDIVVKADGDNANASFDADAIAVIGSNSKTIQVAFASDTNFSSDYITETFSMAKFGDSSNKLRVNAADNNVIFIDDGQYAPYVGQLVDGGGSGRMNLNRGKRAWIEMYTGTGDEYENMYEITRHVGSTAFHVDAPSSVFSSLAGTSIRIYVDRGVFFFRPSNLYVSSKHKFMKIRPKENTATGYYEIGSVVVGTTFTLDNMPMEWTYTDNQQPNITTYRTKGAVQWGFVEGPPQRSMESLFVGDSAQNREKMRGLMNQTASYSRLPIVFGFTVTPSVDSAPKRILGHDNVMLSWVKSGGDLKQAAWYKDTNGIWRNAGDMAISLTECV